MAEYIDRDSFLKFLGEEFPGQAPHGAIVVGLLADFPPAEAVRPVVMGAVVQAKRHDATRVRRPS